MGASGGIASSASAGDDLLLGRYEVLERLGAGGFGVVWHALDRRLERHVALKEVRDDAGDGPTERALREARAAAALNHPGIVALYEVGRDSEAIYLVYELVVGHTLADLFRRDALSDADLARIGAGIGDALEHAHGRGIVHRDVKPHNVMVVAEPEHIARRDRPGAGWAKLTDFGIAHLALGEGITAPGEVLGSLAYMAPEQAEGKEVTGAADVYALALTLYEGFTGENPRRGPGALAARRSRRPPPPLRSRRRDLPAALGSAIDRALDPRPARRPSARELSEALARTVPGLTEDPELTQALAAPPRWAPARDGSGDDTGHGAAPWGSELDSPDDRMAAAAVDPDLDGGRPRHEGWDSLPDPDDSELPTRHFARPSWADSPFSPRGHAEPIRPDPDLQTRHDPAPAGFRDRGRAGRPSWHARAGAAPPPAAAAGEWAAPASRADESPGLRGRARSGVARLTAAACVAAAVVLVLRGLPSDVAAPDVYLIAAGAAAAVALLPRLGFLAVLAAGVIWLGLGPPGLPGAALVVALASLAAPVLMPRAGTSWPLPALTAVLVIPGVPVAFLGLTGLARSAWRRAALGAAGALATAAMVALARAGPDGWRRPRGARWMADPYDAVDRVVFPALEAGLPLLALGWAALAVLLPLAVGAGRAAVRLTGAAVWCALAVAVHAGAVTLATGAGAAEAGVAALPGAVLAAAVGSAATVRKAARGAGRDAERL